MRTLRQYGGQRTFLILKDGRQPCTNTGGYKSADLLFGFNLGRPKGISGVNLWYTYLIWIGVIIILYPLCKWYGRYKENHKKKKWLRYL